MSGALDSYCATLTRMAGGRAHQVLNRQIRYQGRVASRADHILAEIAAGARVETRTSRDYAAEEKLRERIERVGSSHLDRWAQEIETRNRLRGELAELEKGVSRRVLMTGDGTWLDERDWGATALDFAQFVSNPRP